MGMGKSGGKKKSRPNDSAFQNKFVSMSDQDAYQFYNDVTSDNGNPNIDLSGLNQYNDLQKLVAALGMHEKPVVLNDSDWDSNFAAGNALDGVYLYRGVKDNSSMSAKDIIDQIKYGDKTFIGDGIHGDGIYFTTNYDYAHMYSRYNQANMTQAYIDKSKANVVTEKNIRAMQKNETGNLRWMDLSSYALKKGYNVIHVPGGNADGKDGVVGQGNSYRTKTGRKRRGGEDYYVPLTRSVLVIRDNVKR